MNYSNRLEMFKEIEKKRNSRIITLCTSDRYSTIPFNGISAQIANDQVGKIIQHLKKIGYSDNIDLFLYSRGGDINSAWPLVSSIRNYCQNFTVIVPVHAHSTATLIALGANKIILCKTGSLSPVDPTVANPFNPKDEASKQPLGISVEDVSSYFDLAIDDKKTKIGDEDNITKIFEILANKVHPLALGNVKRSHSQIRLLANKLLTLHLEKDNESIQKIVDALTERLYTHYHSIYRLEAINEIGLKDIIVLPDQEDENLYWNLYKSYEKEMKLKDYFEPNSFLGDLEEKDLETETVFIESTEMSSSFKTIQTLSKELPPDHNFRLQTATQNLQFQQSLSQLRTQIVNVRQQVLNLRANVNNSPLAQSLNQIFDSVDNNIVEILNSTPTGLNLDNIRKFIDTKCKFIGWVDSNP